MNLRKLVLAAGLGVACTLAPAAAQIYTDAEFARITEGVDAFLDQLTASEDFAPGSVVTISTADGHRYVRADGVLNAGGDVPATADTQFYIASMTKAYMGLLAARLDAEGVLSLDSTLADAWPNLVMPDGIDPSAITMRDLLSHQLGFEAGDITLLEAYIRDVAPEEYPMFLEQFSVPTEPGYEYDNLGYNIYAAVLEGKTGINWRDWLNDYIFDPLEMTGTSGRVSDFRAENVAWGHQNNRGMSPFWPQTDEWYLIPPKTDGIMQSAGGLMTTGTDLAIWMEANLRHESPGYTDAMFAVSHTAIAEQEADGHGFSCSGYSLGWETCEYLHLGTAEDGSTPPPVNVIQHGGGYIGFGSLFTLAPEIGIGVAIAHNSDGPMFYVDLELSKLVLDLALNLNQQSIEEANIARLERFAAFNERFAVVRQERMDDYLPPEARGDWAPDAEELSSLVGSYHNDEYFIHDFTLTLEGDHLVLQADGYRTILAPITYNVFGAYLEPVSPPDLVGIIRNEAGEMEAIEWDGEMYFPVMN